MAKVKALFYIPLRDNDGRSLATETLDLQAEFICASWDGPSWVMSRVLFAWRMARKRWMKAELTW